MEISDEEIEALYFFLSYHEESLPDILYSLKNKMEKRVFERMTIEDIEKIKRSWIRSDCSGNKRGSDFSDGLVF